MPSFDKQGDHSSAVFAGESELLANKKMYAEGITLFADILRQRLTPGQYDLLDLGSYKGEFVASVLRELPDYDFTVTAVDANYLALHANQTAHKSVVANILDIDLPDGYADVGICRFVINWNMLRLQPVMIKEIVRVVKQFVIVQHSGTDSADPEHRRRINTVLSGVIPKIQREDFCHSTSAELEGMLNAAGIRYTKIQEQRIENVSDMFFERYGLSDTEHEQLIEILGDYDYILQSTWVFEAN